VALTPTLTQTFHLATLPARDEEENLRGKPVLASPPSPQQVSAWAVRREKRKSTIRGAGSQNSSTLCPVDFVADRGGCNGDSPRVGGFGTASATPLIERSAAPRPSTATELSPQICSWGLEKTPAPGGPTPPQSGRSPRPLVAERAAPAPSDMMRTSQG